MFDIKDVKQITCNAGEQTLFEMQLKRSQFLVKNFTGDTITVKLGDNETVSIIGAESWERVFNNIDNRQSKTAEATNKVYVTATQQGLVEVASIDF